MYMGFQNGIMINKIQCIYLTISTSIGPILSFKPIHKAKPIGTRYNLISDRVERSLVSRLCSIGFVITIYALDSESFV